jgi:hypothetical protein
MAARKKAIRSTVRHRSASQSTGTVSVSEIDEIKKTCMPVAKLNDPVGSKGSLL